MAKWGLELLVTGMYLFGGVCMLVFAIRKNKPFVLVLSGVILVTAGWIFFSKGVLLEDFNGFTGIFFVDPESNTSYFINGNYSIDVKTFEEIFPGVGLIPGEIGNKMD